VVKRDIVWRAGWPGRPDEHGWTARRRSMARKLLRLWGRIPERRYRVGGFRRTEGRIRGRGLGVVWASSVCRIILVEDREKGNAALPRHWTTLRTTRTPRNGWMWPFPEQDRAARIRGFMGVR